jgi:hypothetical protein
VGKHTHVAEPLETGKALLGARLVLALAGERLAEISMAYRHLVPHPTTAAA